LASVGIFIRPNSDVARLTPHRAPGVLALDVVQARDWVGAIAHGQNRVVNRGAATLCVVKDAAGVQQKGLKMVRPSDVEALLRADPVGKEDLAAALRTTKPSSDGNIIRSVTPSIL